MADLPSPGGPTKTRLPLHWQIILAMFFGAGIGVPLNFVKSQGWVSERTLSGVSLMGESAGRIFLALLSMVVVPLVFTSLVTAVTGLRGQGGLRRLGSWSMAYFATTSLLAITVGIALSNLIRPGAGVNYHELLAKAGSSAAAAKLPASAGQESIWTVVGGILFRTVPSNVIESASSNRNMLSVIFFAVIFGYFINQIESTRAQRTADFFEDIFEVMMKMTNGIIKLAPYGIFGYVLHVTASTGLELVGPLAKYMLTVFLGLFIHGVIILPLLVYAFTRRSPLALARGVAPALATAFSTASSSGTLPLTIANMNERVGVRPSYTSFVLPLGATINMNGTALYEAAAVLFVAQMLGDLSLVQQIVVAFTALLASIGAAGIPHAGTVMMVIVLQAVGLPTEAVLTILAVDRVLDMLRTTVNVWSDVTCTAIVSHWDEKLYGGQASASGAAG